MQSPYRFVRVCFAAVLISILISSCDTVGDDTLTLQKEVDFRFEFTTTDAGDEVVVTSVGQIDFEDLLTAEGISREEILAAEARTVQIERITPAGASLSAFDRITFSLSASGLTVPPIAESNDLPDGRSADLMVLSDDVTQVVRRPEFSGRLTVIPSGSTGEDYVLISTMNVVVQAEGV